MNKNQLLTLVLISLILTPVTTNGSVKLFDLTKTNECSTNKIKKNNTLYQSQDECLRVCYAMAKTDPREANVCVQYCEDQKTDKHANTDRKWSSLGNSAMLLWGVLNAL